MPMPYTVLVAEDDPAVLELVTEALMVAGYRVHRATNGHDALSVLEQSGIDLLVTDGRMPRVDGIELSALVRERRPHLPIVYVTGFSDCLNKLTGTVLHKPFRHADLVSAIGRELSAA